MKQLILLMILSLPLLAVRGQSKVSYTYDASGNRNAAKRVVAKNQNEEISLPPITLKSENGRVCVIFPQYLNGATFSVYGPSGKIIYRAIMNQSPWYVGLAPDEKGIYIIKINKGSFSKEFKITR